MTHGTRAGMALPRPHGVGARRPMTLQSTCCHLLSEISTMHACGLGSLAGSLPPAALTIIFTSWGTLSSNGLVT